ncbi:MAG: hypothetical protein ACYC2H_09735 [Thermoplasmatota archaeon]
MALDLARSVLFAAGAAMLAIAILILVLRPARGLNRALAALVAVRGTAILLPQVSGDPSWAWTAQSVQPYFALAVVPLALYCLHAFTSLGTGRRRPGTGWFAALAVVLLGAIYLGDHSLVQTLAWGDADVGALQAAPGIHYASFGPLWLLVGAAPVLLAYLGLRSVVQYRQDPTSRNARLLLFVGAGLVLGGLFDGASRLAALTSLLDQPGTFPWLPWGWAVVVLPVLALAPALMAVAVLAARPRASAHVRPRTERGLLVLAGFAFFSGFARLMAPADSDVAGNALVLILLGLWRLAMPLLIAFGLGQPADARATLPSTKPDPRGTRDPLDALDARTAMR